MKLTPKVAVKLERELMAGLNDPMTRHYHAGECVADSFRAKLRKMGVCAEDVHIMAQKRREKTRATRLAHRDPARLKWKEQQSQLRADFRVLPGSF